ncbi:MAG TPA: PKD domain-containing protein [Thermoplasmata archaeon]|nr:PKD domain-containing protein [Thermoplasmata archaeon]
MSTPTAAVVMVVVLALVAAGGYFAFSGIKPTTSSSTQCSPTTSYICQNLAAGHDMTLLVPFRATQAGTTVPFTANFLKGESSTNFNFSFGDGNFSKASTPTASHVYTEPGAYLASVTSTVAGVDHDNYQSLVAIVVSPSYASSQSGSAPTVNGAIVSNSSASSAATAVLTPGQSVTLSGSYTSAPTDPAFLAKAPTIVAKGPGVQVSKSGGTNVSFTSTVLFQQAGIYPVAFVGTASSASTTVAQSYVWTVFVAPTGLQAGISGGAVTAKSPHPGTLEVYELAPGGSTSEDPAIDYETVGFEPVTNVYQTLIAYNGSDAGPGYQNFVPQLAACVPGSPQCAQLFGGNNLSTGTSYTFVLNGVSQFYDPSTGNHWGVYPSDALFSFIRTVGFATQPTFAANPGWILGQSILSTGNGTWDGGIHATLNNTPQGVFGAIGVNTSACPAAAMSAPYHGCLTLNANANGVNWPFFLELISDGQGGAVVPCGWFSASAQGAGIPGWNPLTSSSDQGDHPCLLPGGATSTLSAAFQQATSLTNMTPTSWDAWESASANSGQNGNVRWSMAGSGPYYMASLKIGSSYLLKANPDYVQNPSCTWTGCEPAAGSYAGTVSVLWEQSQLPGEEAYSAGQADFATIPPTDTALLLQLVQQQKVAATTFPTLSIYFFPFTLNFNLASAEKYTTNPISVPTDFFTNVGVRNFFVNAYPYQTTEQTISTKDGIQYLFNYGGAIPQFMANYYPTNISWPNTDPGTNPAVAGSAAWWWAGLTNASNPATYDPELAGCTSANPCEVPFFGQTGAPDFDQRLALWASEVSTLSKGALKMDVLDVDFIDLVLNSLYNGPGLNPMPVYELGWAPDYPDPTDYMVALYQPDGSYTHADAVSEQLENGPTYTTGPYNQTSCHNWQDFGYWSNLASTAGGITNACQGTAYAAMTYAIKLAAHLPAGPQRVLFYNMAEHIANALALYGYWGQDNLVVSYAPWLNGSMFNTNVTIGGGKVQTWFTIPAAA